ncbi:histone deacetylase [Solicola gregarius]|uniref:Histone deacetylase n=1 Tax=Solicola gregarius TaxID=2908642 RepID=A0AA46YJK1_9ACTN|nr:histone deacetylase [Solicola gregarius]UYM03581.1 histone deacetylase [Solicola gregarius]
MHQLDEPLVWYVAYGSNLSAERFACYVVGGRPAGSLRDCPGFRDDTPPRAVRSVTVPGGIYFAGESRVWTGGTAFLDPDADGVVAARAYLITVAQFADLAEQEMLRAPGADRDLSVVLAEGRHSYGTGRYETLLRLGAYEGTPMLTVSAPWSPSTAKLSAPTGDYLRMIGRGLVETHAWDSVRAGSYLADAPGALGSWRADQVAALLG